MTQGRFKSLASDPPGHGPGRCLIFILVRSKLCSSFCCDMMLLFPSSKMMRRWAVCVTSIALLYFLQRHTRHQQLYTALQESQTVISASAAPNPGSALLNHPIPQSPPTLSQLIASDPDHYPPWDGYKNRDYDPNHWHFLPM
jgi:hypothetical protein